MILTAVCLRVWDLIECCLWFVECLVLVLYCNDALDCVVLMCLLLCNKLFNSVVGYRLCDYIAQSILVPHSAVSVLVLFN